MSLLASVCYAVLVTISVYGLYEVIYRLYLSPVAKFPGSKLAALTFWYEFYYDVIKRGTYMWEVERMHEIYGELSQSLIEYTNRRPRTCNSHQPVRAPRI